MKSFVIPYITSTGQKVFPYQLDGKSENIWAELGNGRQLLAYDFPEGQTLQATWELRFIFDANLVLEFSSASTQVDGWHEVGSLNIKMTQTDSEKPNNKGLFPAFTINSVQKLICEDDLAIVECGLVLINNNGEEIIVAAGISPGSVSVLAPFASIPLFTPLIPLAKCRRGNL